MQLIIILGDVEFISLHNYVLMQRYQLLRKTTELQAFWSSVLFRISIFIFYALCSVYTISLEIVSKFHKANFTM